VEGGGGNKSVHDDVDWRGGLDGSGGKKFVDELTSSFLSEFLFILHVTTSTPVSDGLSGNMDRVDGSVDSNSREEDHLILRTRMWFYMESIWGTCSITRLRT
jgi:hypothetical protein